MKDFNFKGVCPWEIPQRNMELLGFWKIKERILRNGSRQVVLFHNECSRTAKQEFIDEEGRDEVMVLSYVV